MRTLTRETKEWVAVAVTFVAVFAVLAIVSYGARGVAWGYLIGVLLLVCIYALFALGLSLQFGHGGLLNFGHVAFMGVGAYTMAIVSLKFQDALAPRMEGVSALGLATAALGALLAAALALVPALLAAQALLKRRSLRARAIAGGAVAALVGLAAFLGMFPFTDDTAANGVVLLGALAGIVLAALASLLLGLPAVRLREDYLAIVTLGFAELFRSIAVNQQDLTRGTQGITGIQRPIADWASETGWWGDLVDLIPGRPVSDTTAAHALVALVLVALVFLILHTLARSPWGRVLRAIREDDSVAAALGKNVTLWKLQALMIGAAVAAVAGILYVWNFGNVYPEHFPNILTFYAFIILVMGGIGNHKGALIGALILWGIFELAGNLSGFAFIQAGPSQQIFIGVILILVMLLRPHGTIGRKEELVLGK